MASFQVSIEMDPQTVERLTADGYSLYGFKAVRGAQSGQPTVWLKATEFMTTLQVGWEDRYQAYTSTTPAISNGQVRAGARYDISLGQVLMVESRAGTGTVTDQGVPGAISITNTTPTQFTCGVAQQLGDGVYAPQCAFPLPGRFANVMQPVEKVFLMFSPIPVSTGTVVTQAYSYGVLIDLTGVTGRTVSFDITTGWSWQDTAPWATLHPAGTPLAPLLIWSTPG